MGSMAAPLARRRFTVEEFHRMVEAGVLGEDDRIELLDGEIVEMTPIGPRHAGGVNRLTRLFGARLRERVVVGVQNPVVLGPYWEPQPDLALLKARDDFYAHAHPGPEDVLLIVEVEETSLDVDRRVKVPAYARAGVAETWLLNLADDRLEVFRDPAPEGYRDVRRLGRGDRVALVALPEIEFAVEEILG